MKALAEIELELSRLGVRNRFWGKPEIRELQHVLSPDEVISRATSGRYEGGFCLLVATDRRLLLIDKKLWFLSMEDVRFDMISELDYCARLLDSTLSVRTINKVLRFYTIHQKQLRALTNYLQERIMELRHVYQQNSGSVVQVPVPTPMYQQPMPIVDAGQQFVAPPVVDPVQQFYATQINYTRPNRLRRIGSYPTSSLTMNRRASTR